MAIPVNVVGRNMQVTDRAREYVTKKVSKFDRYLTNIEEAVVELRHDASARSATDRHVAQITVYGKRLMLRSEERNSDLFAAIDAAVDKIQRQIARYKGKKYRGRGTSESVSQQVMEEELLALEREAAEEEEPVIARRKRFLLYPMDEREAIEQMKLLGHDNFFVFYNATTDRINVLYRRRDGTYGLIDPEIG